MQRSLGAPHGACANMAWAPAGLANVVCMEDALEFSASLRSGRHTFETSACMHGRYLYVIDIIMPARKRICRMPTEAAEPLWPQSLRQSPQNIAFIILKE